MSKNSTIIYIDDEKINLQLFKTIMSKKFNVLTGLSAYEGLQLLEDHDDVKVVLTDLKMPGMSGIDFINIASQKYNHLKFFLLTGYETTQEIQELLDSKISTNYFRKPLNMCEIELAINNVLEK